MSEARALLRSVGEGELGDRSVSRAGGLHCRGDARFVALHELVNAFNRQGVGGRVHDVFQAPQGSRKRLEIGIGGFRHPEDGAGLPGLKKGEAIDQLRRGNGGGGGSGSVRGDLARRERVVVTERRDVFIKPEVMERPLEAITELLIDSLATSQTVQQVQGGPYTIGSQIHRERRATPGTLRVPSAA